MFESDVNSDSIQTRHSNGATVHLFESDVNSDSIQTKLMKNTMEM